MLVFSVSDEENASGHHPTSPIQISSLPPSNNNNLHEPNSSLLLQSSLRYPQPPTTSLSLPSSNFAQSQLSPITQMSPISQLSQIAPISGQISQIAQPYPGEPCSYGPIYHHHHHYGQLPGYGAGKGAQGRQGAYMPQGPFYPAPPTQSTARSGAPVVGGYVMHEYAPR